jgi:Tol biopolymer transport system component/DNA-binding winged helix-turn-helix (wHTH) protein
MAVLVLLAQANGEVVTRERLLEEVWNGAFVGDDVITRAIGELRRLFEDDPKSPRVIETIRKRGYRLLLPVIALDRDACSSLEAPAADVVPSTWSDQPNPNRRLLAAAIAATTLLLVAALAWALGGGSGRPDRTIPARPTVSVVPLTSGPETERDPAVSPDGTRIAYSVLSEDGTRGRLVVQLRKRPPVLELTDGTMLDRYPAWSPDGTELAFVRTAGTECDVAIIAATGGPIRRLLPCSEAPPERLAWSPDGRTLALSKPTHEHRAWAIFLLDLETLELQQLTRPPSLNADLEPVFSPDGRSLAFTRAMTMDAAEVWTVEIASSAERQLTFDFRDVQGQAFDTAGNRLRFASNRAGTYALWSIPASGGEPKWLTGSGAKLKHPSSARSADVLAFEEWRFEIDIWQRALEGGFINSPDGTRAVERPVVRSAAWDFAPAISPDGHQLAFVSSRSGSHEIWLVAAIGGDPIPLSRNAMQLLSPPVWSPSGDALLFAAFDDQGADLWSVAPNGATALRLTADRALEIAPSWSADGRNVLFGSEQDGSWSIWSLPANGGSPRRLGDGLAARESPGGTLVVQLPGKRELYRWERDRGPVPLMPGEGPHHWADWQVRGEEVCWVHRGAPPDATTELRCTRIAGGPIRTLADLGEIARPGIALSPDGKSVYFARTARADVDLVVAENLG